MLEFAGAKTDQKTGRIELTWPVSERARKEKGRENSSVPEVLRPGRTCANSSIMPRPRTHQRQPLRTDRR
jgi:hypothetical protein